MKKYKYISFTVITLICFIFSLSCASMNKNGYTSPGTENDYERLGISKTAVEIWEDGMRTDGNKGNYEWWYFDAKLDDGSTLVIVFYTKNILNINTLISPLVTVKMTDANGKPLLEKFYTSKDNDFYFSKKRCDIKIGKNAFSGDLKEYYIHLDFDSIRADIRLQGTAPSWRPALGHSFFTNKSGTTYFAWLPSVPQGKVNGTIEINGKTTEITGSGYHDHNWGNDLIFNQMHDWYWGRAEVGPYAVISSWITSTRKYGGKPNPVFFLSRNGKIIAENGLYVTCTMGDVYVDKNTGKPVANVLIYEYNDGTNHYRVTYEREKDIENIMLIKTLKGFKNILARIAGFDGAYLRFSGKVTIEEIKGEKVIDSVSKDDAVWELMYLGHAQETVSGKDLKQ